MWIYYLLLLLFFWKLALWYKQFLKYYFGRQRYNDWKLKISYGSIKWTTFSMNRSFESLSKKFPTFWLWWFSFGAFFGLFAVLFSVLILSTNLFRLLFVSAKREDQILTLIIPGISIPMSQMIYILTTLTLNAFFHELGHAIAAVRDSVHIHGCGIMVLWFWLAAFVDFSTHSLNLASPIKRLRIFAAGSWHNLILALICLLLFHQRSYLLYPMYYQDDSGVMVTQVTDPILSSHVHPGDIVRSVNGRFISRLDDWDKFFQEHERLIASNGTAAGRFRSGYCHRLSDGESIEKDCCENTLESNSMLCWTKSIENQENQNILFCKEPKNIVQQTTKHCTGKLDCQPDEDCVGLYGYDRRMIFSILVESRSRPVLYLGYPSQLYWSVLVSEYKPRWFWMNVEWILFCNFPFILEQMLSYLISMSAALGLMNLAPVYYLDGEFYFETLMDWLGWEKATHIVLKFTSALLLLNIAVSFWNVFSW